MNISQSAGFEPALPEGNWFLVSRLNHSATTASWYFGIDCQISLNLLQFISIVWIRYFDFQIFLNGNLHRHGNVKSHHHFNNNQSLFVQQYIQLEYNRDW